MEVCGDLHCPQPPFNPVLLLRLQHLLQHLLSSSSSSSRGTEVARASITRWLCGRSDDPAAFKKGASVLLQHCSSLLQQYVHPVLLLLYKRRLLGGGPFGAPHLSSYEGGPHLWSVRGVGWGTEGPGGPQGPPGPPESVEGIFSSDSGLRRGGPSRGVMEGVTSLGAPWGAPGEGKESLALAIEGGAMRGCVCAGMAICLSHLGFIDAFNGVYGSSAGALIGAFAVSRQLAYEGSAVYTDWLPSLGKGFINPFLLGRALGLGCLLDGDISSFLCQRLGAPLLNLNTLFFNVLQHKQPFHWKQFAINNKKQPLKVHPNTPH